MDNNDKKVKDMLTSHEIPKELEPESIKTMLDEKADKIHRKKRNGIIKIVSAAAACAVVCTFGEKRKYNEKFTSCKSRKLCT